MKRMLLLLFLLVFNISVICFASTADKIATKKIEKTNSNKKVNTIVYNNKKYGFKFNLPGTWKNYRIRIDKWEGLAIDNNQGEKVVQTGPIILIRHPKWTEKNQRQDIPIMIFTLSQWKLLQKDKFHIGAAPIGPTELGRNNKYVFALPARYNFAYRTGYEEVDNIVKNKSLYPINVK